MKLNENALANASAVITGLVYLVCGVAIALLPEFSKLVAQSWFHGIDITKIWAGTPFPGNFVLGFITVVVGAWVTGWAFAWVYNRLVK